MEPSADLTTVTRTVDLDLSPDDLWPAIADSDRLAGWLGDDVDIDIRSGGTGVVVDAGVEREVVVADVVDGRRLAFTWWEPGDPATTATVVFDVEATPTGSRLTITETLLAATPTTVEASRTRWEVRVLSLWACTVAAALVR